MIVCYLNKSWSSISQLLGLKVLALTILYHTYHVRSLSRWVTPDWSALLIWHPVCSTRELPANNTGTLPAACQCLTLHGSNACQALAINTFCQNQADTTWHQHTIPPSTTHSGLYGVKPYRAGMMHYIEIWHSLNLLISTYVM